MALSFERGKGMRGFLVVVYMPVCVLNSEKYLTSPIRSWN